MRLAQAVASAAYWAASRYRVATVAMRRRRADTLPLREPRIPSEAWAGCLAGCSAAEDSPSRARTRAAI